jgi:hypothetical protein
MTSKEFVIGAFILICSLLPYIHDAIPRETQAGISGYSSLRVFLYITLINVFGLIGWLMAYFEAKGKRYRFVMIIPIINIAYQLFIYILSLKKTSFNDLNLKFLITFIVSVLVFLFYFMRKFKSKESA